MGELLDIVIPHASEDWGVCGKAYDMLRAQLGADLSQVRVITVHDGSDYWPDDRIRVPGLRQDQVRIPKAGVSEARNRGLDACSAEWVMFCDCDDLFASVWSLHCILDALRSERAQNNDLLWYPFYVETVGGGRDVCKDFNWIFVHGKIYRRSWLVQRRLRFPAGLYYAEDSAFNALVEMDIDPERVARIDSDAVLYVWALNPMSVTSRPENRLRNALGLMDRNALIADALRRRGRDEDALELMARTAWDGFYLWQWPGQSDDDRQEIRLRLRTACSETPDLIRRAGTERMERIRKEARKEALRRGGVDAQAKAFAAWYEMIMT